MDETACKSYVEHLEFLDAKAKKRVRERNALPSNISWKNKNDVEALTNNQLNDVFETTWSQDKRK